MKRDTHFIVKTSKATVGGRIGRYVNVAVMEVPVGIDDVHAIRDTKKNSVVKRWGKLNIGTTDRCASAIGIKAAEELASRLNELREGRIS